MKKLQIRLFLGLLLLHILPLGADAARMLVPVGQVVGLELQNNTVTVAAFDEASQAEAAGIRIGDRFVTVDGHSITCVEDIRTALERSDGTVDITLDRQGHRAQVQVTPEITAGGPKLGVYLRQGITGIGTVTFYDPQTKAFGTLGHIVSKE